MGAVVLAVVVAIAAAVLLQDWSVRRRVQGRLAERLPRDAREFGLAHFGESDRRARLAARVVEILEEHIDLPLRGVHPDDRPVEDLMMDELDSLATVEVVVAFEKEFGIQIPDADAQALSSIRDIVEYLDRRGVSP